MLKALASGRAVTASSRVKSRWRRLLPFMTRQHHATQHCQSRHHRLCDARDANEAICTSTPLTGDCLLIGQAVPGSSLCFLANTKKTPRCDSAYGVDEADRGRLYLSFPQCRSFVSQRSIFLVLGCYIDAIQAVELRETHPPCTTKIQEDNVRSNDLQT